MGQVFAELSAQELRSLELALKKVVNRAAALMEQRGVKPKPRSWLGDSRRESLDALPPRMSASSAPSNAELRRMCCLELTARSRRRRLQSRRTQDSRLPGTFGTESTNGE